MSEIPVNLNNPTEVLAGKVTSIRAIRRDMVDLEIKDVPRAIRLLIHEDWAISKGDSLTLAATARDNGVMVSFAYRNDSKSVTGYRRDKTSIPLLLMIAFGILAVTALPTISDLPEPHAVATLGLSGTAAVLIPTVGIRNDLRYRTLLKKHREAIGLE